MKVDSFDYQLPKQIIAQTPLEKRSSSKLLVLNRCLGTMEDHYFRELPAFLTENDVLVLNDTKVLPSRIIGQKVDTQAKIELLLLKEEADYWETLVRPARRIKVGTMIDFASLFTGEILAKFNDGLCHVRFHYQGVFLDLLSKLGTMPLPPYIHTTLKDPNRYQTIYAKTLGSAAAPTAGLHFDDEVFKQLRAKKVRIAYVSLHIGLGTFRSVSVENVEDHQMHSEWFSMPKETADLLNAAKQNRQRIICVGTTSTRTLEAIYQKYHRFVATTEATNLFIYPGYRFLAVDALITNFHLPKSTLLMLVSAFYSQEKIMDAYQYAITHDYRFFSFGDAMFIQ
ncbi:MAG TPA: tRNA preQ1(34) S-adenosylmethionine ribosyltransferase-isomerase QueA [Bacilli bacterium]|nr:MAG: S-adenosylmethionine:tRNA ribosyltransferase-isomerase [Tenericutes bacterium ADurb.BinA124]HPX83961.1 tRNA preQ1(34) S-adenosylmethionine ribosyltransferase-isomerase QueA [Bacilli bacterium]